MYKLFKISTSLLLEQDGKLMDLRKAIIERKPITIQYSGPAGEVLTGPRYDIEPVVMGTNAKSGNLVIWAYVFRGVSKKGLPGWKMFRVDRITNIDPSGFDKDSFKLSDLPGYQRGKAPNAMRSLDQVYIYSPYWYEDYKRYEKKPYQPAPPTPELPPEAEVPDTTKYRLDTQVFNDLKQKVRTVNGQQTITMKDYNDAIQNLYWNKEGEWKNYQKLVTGNVKPGEGTRQRFEMSSKKEIDDLLRQNNITISDAPENEGGLENVNEPLAEIKKRFKDLIFS